ncbi:MAG: Uncharacterised protein [Cellulomonadaceae bacterium TMED98]|nr:MAG: Uncharacterised protein [Cellulomonadaceae bacterium TMED98]
MCSLQHFLALLRPRGTDRIDDLSKRRGFPALFRWQVRRGVERIPRRGREDSEGPTQLFDERCCLREEMLVDIRVFFSVNFDGH